ncbi:eukaryotic translation initiation factor 2 [Clonorchis sinensis]|uniref:Eukaryotic translation initiation factor 2 subunit 2 n=1 Tax=Clonorchis sinensis TaxID=79923 RepID=A0A3R7CKX6_CLOSI|nr:eukaryotic translation initiation factor 2 [Clonorchis sinensis]
MTDQAQGEDILNFEVKKKKKNKALADITAVDTGDSENPLDFGAKKKKKAKPLDIPDAVVAETGENDPLIDELKLKKKKKVAINEENIDELAEKLDDELSFGGKKKKKKPKTVDAEDELGTWEPDTLVKENVDASGFTYEMLLTRVFTQLGTLNPELVSDQKRRLVMVPPQMARVGTKKTLFVNFATICRFLNRDQSHLTTYILAELGTQGSVDANGALLIRGRYQSKHMEPVLRNYCRNYVLCGTCQSSETDLCKDSRLLFLHCRRCGSRITVKNVTSGFQAVTGRRAAIRAKTQ